MSPDNQPTYLFILYCSVGFTFVFMIPVRLILYYKIKSKVIIIPEGNEKELSKTEQIESKSNDNISHSSYNIELKQDNNRMNVYE